MPLVVTECVLGVERGCWSVQHHEKELGLQHHTGCANRL